MLTRRRLFWLVLLLAVLVAAFAWVSMGGCSARGVIPGGVSLEEYVSGQKQAAVDALHHKHQQAEEDRVSHQYAIIGYLADACLCISVATAILSIWVPFFSTKGSIGCGILAVLLWALKYTLETWLHVATNIIIIVAGLACLVVAIPFVVAWVNAHLRGVAKRVGAMNPIASKVLTEVSKGETKLADRLLGILPVAPPVASTGNGAS